MARATVTNRLPQFVDRQQRRAAGAVLAATITGAAEASVLTPIDTSNLLNGQYRRVDRDGYKVVGRVGYLADYALAVHDPDNPQTFRRATAEKKFLVKGFERNMPKILEIMRKVMKV